MVRLAANLSTMFQEHAFLTRFEKAAEAGFKGVEFMFPYDHPAAEVAEAARSNSLEIALFNLPAGDWAGGDRGLAALPERVEECREGVERALEYASALGCDKLHLMAGTVLPDERSDLHERTYVENVRYAADQLAEQGATLLVEAINTRVDIPGYYLDSSHAAERLIGIIDRPNVLFQYDIYHMQIMEGDLARRIEQMFDMIGHIQLADNPGRREPGTGEIDYPWLLQRIDDLGYDGWIGCEYKPAGDTVEGLGWAGSYL